MVHWPHIYTAGDIKLDLCTINLEQVLNKRRLWRYQRNTGNERPSDESEWFQNGIGYPENIIRGMFRLLNHLSDWQNQNVDSLELSIYCVHHLRYSTLVDHFSY